MVPEKVGGWINRLFNANDSVTPTGSARKGRN